MFTWVASDKLALSRVIVKVDKTTKGSYRQNKEKLAKGENYKREIDPGIYTKKKKSIQELKKKKISMRGDQREVQYAFQSFILGIGRVPTVSPPFSLFFKK